MLPRPFWLEFVITQLRQTFKRDRQHLEPRCSHLNVPQGYYIPALILAAEPLTTAWQAEVKSVWLLLVMGQMEENAPTEFSAFHKADEGEEAVGKSFPRGKNFSHRKQDLILGNCYYFATQKLPQHLSAFILIASKMAQTIPCTLPDLLVQRRNRSFSQQRWHSLLRFLPSQCWPPTDLKRKKFSV